MTQNIDFLARAWVLSKTVDTITNTDHQVITCKTNEKIVQIQESILHSPIDTGINTDIVVKISFKTAKISTDKNILSHNIAIKIFIHQKLYFTRWERKRGDLYDSFKKSLWFRKFLSQDSWARSKFGIIFFQLVLFSNLKRENTMQVYLYLLYNRLLVNSGLKTGLWPLKSLFTLQVSLHYDHLAPQPDLIPDHFFEHLD